MRDIEFWKLCDEYSIVQAALLACGSDPEDLQYSVENNDRERPGGYIPIRTALYNAVRARTLQATIVDSGYNNGADIDLHSTTIGVADLDTFLRARGFVCPYFERLTHTHPSNSIGPNSKFPPKLDAAIKAWNAVTSDPHLLRGKSPKQALEKWLKEHAVELGLLNRDGKPNNSGIEEISKVANWKPGGGAVATPTAQADPGSLTVVDRDSAEAVRWKPRPPPPRCLDDFNSDDDFTSDVEDDIPF